MPIGSDLGVTWPIPGETTNWGSPILTELNKILLAVEGTVTPGAMDIDADLDFQSNPAIGLEYVEFETAIADRTTSGDELSLYAGPAGELYFTDGNLNAIQLTSLGVLNIAATGAITGSGYGSGGVEISWDSSGDEFELKNGAGAGDFAHCRASGFRISSTATPYQLELDVDTLTGSYSLTFPDGVSAGIFQTDGSGNVDFVTEVTFPLNAAYVDVDYIKYSTAQIEPQDVVAGLQVNGSTWDIANPGHWWRTGSVAGVTNYLYTPITGLRVGERITEFTLNCLGASGMAMNARIVRKDSTGAFSLIGAGDTSTESATQQALTDTVINHTVLADNAYLMRLTPGGTFSGGNWYLYNLEVGIDKIA